MIFGTPDEPDSCDHCGHFDCEGCEKVQQLEKDQYCLNKKLGHPCRDCASSGCKSEKEKTGKGSD